MPRAKTPRTMQTRYARGPSDAPSSARMQVGIDEAGRGPLLGRVYTAAVVLPEETDSFKIDFNMVKDSKRFTSEKRLLEAEEYIKANALFWSVSCRDEKEIDRYNILSCTLSAMQDAARDVVLQATTSGYDVDDVLLIVDGNNFRPVAVMTDEHKFRPVSHVLVPKGDDTYAQIAAASILAKSARDRYIYELCDKEPALDTLYDIRSNKGYGTKRHMDAIAEHGPSEWHRRSFAPCR